jgi:hypothetical protein
MAGGVIIATPPAGRRGSTVGVPVGLSVELVPEPDWSCPVGAALLVPSDGPGGDAEPVGERVALEVMLPVPDREPVAVTVGLDESAVGGTDVLATTEP